jgi:hypothetical protein
VLDSLQVEDRLEELQKHTVLFKCNGYWTRMAKVWRERVRRSYGIFLSSKGHFVFYFYAMGGREYLPGCHGCRVKQACL